MTGRESGALNFKPCEAEVGPSGVLGLDELDFECAAPFFDLFFAEDGGLDIRVDFIPDQGFTGMGVAEACQSAVFVLMNALGEMAGDAAIEHAVRLGGEKVDPAGFGHEGFWLGFEEGEGVGEVGWGIHADGFMVGGEDVIR